MNIEVSSLLLLSLSKGFLYLIITALTPLIKYGMKMLANICEMTIFLFLGISAISDFWLHWNTPFILWTLFFVTVYRIISVYGLTWVVNRVRLEPIGYVDQFVMAYGGLRGGIAFSLAKLTSLNQVPQVNGCHFTF